MRTEAVAGIIFANAYDESLEKLTLKRSIASVPFGGRYRLIDFSLSNFVNASITNVGIITKEKYRSLMDHIGSGIYWDLDRKKGGVRILPPFNISGTRRYQSYVEALYAAMDFMCKCNAENIVLCDSRTVANVDIDAVVKLHIEKGADVTVVYRTGTEAQNNDDTMSVKLACDGRIESIGFPAVIEKGNPRSMGNLVFKRDRLIELIKLAYENGGISIFKDVIAEYFDELNIYGYEHTGFVAIMDSLGSYTKANMQLLQKNVRRDLFNSERPIFTKTRDNMPTRYGTKSSVKNSLIAEGCVIDGTVENSILFRGVKVAKGAVVKNCILMQGVAVGSDSKLENVISDKNAVIGDWVAITGANDKPFVIEKNQKL